MNYWDSSAIIPLIIAEPKTEKVTEFWEKNNFNTTWTLTSVEVMSTLARLRRMGSLNDLLYENASKEWRKIQIMFEVIKDVEKVKVKAEHLVRIHPLKAADALQLASAMLIAEREPATCDFVTLDEQLGRAASLEGFTVPLL